MAKTFRFCIGRVKKNIFNTGVYISNRGFKNSFWRELG